MNTEACKLLKTHIYEETGNVQALTEQYIAGNTDYVKQRIPQGTFDVSAGEQPVQLRYRSAVPERRKYLNLLVEGNSAANVLAPGCDGANYGFDTNPNRRGSAGCHLPASKITAGYDTFGRSLKGRAWETDVVCAFDLLLKGHAEAYIAMLRRDLPRRGMEEFSTALEDEVIAMAKFNFSMIDGFHYSEGTFPAVPTGTLDIGYLKRIKQFMILQGWTGPFEISVGREALEAAIRDWQSSNNYTIQINNLTQDATGLAGLEALSFEGIQFIINDRPKRGYLELGPDGYQFVEVLPMRNRSGTGDGVVAEPNPDYINCFTICNGVKRELYEVAFSIHSEFAVREALAPVRLAGLNVASMNMDVRMISGPYIDCNEDETKFFLRMLHQYGFRSANPELASAVLYRVAPTPIRVVTSTCPDACTEATLEPVGVAELSPPDADACYDEIYGDCDEVVTHFAHDGTPSAPGPDISDEGVVRFVGLEVEVEAVAGAKFFVIVERFGGYDGQTTVDVDSANGGGGTGATSANGDFVVVNQTLTWADGENGRKRVEVTLGASPEGGEHFHINLSAVTNSTLDTDADQVTVNLLAACGD
jgi:hypothetical protein